MNVGVEVQLHMFLTSAVGCEWLELRRDRLNPDERRPAPVGQKMQWAPAAVLTL